MPPRIFSAGSSASRTPKRFAVSGINCINPWAPFELRACVRPPDSTAISARISAGEMRLPTLCVNISRPWVAAISRKVSKRGAAMSAPFGAFAR